MTHDERANALAKRWTTTDLYDMAVEEFTDALDAACAAAVAAERRATLAEIHAATGPTGGWLVAPSALAATIEARTPPPGGGAG